MTDFQSGMRLTPARLNALPRGIVARGRRVSTSTNTATEQGVLRIDDYVLKAGRLYEVKTSALLVDTNANGSNSIVRLRYTTDGSTPSTSSTQLVGSTSTQPDAANNEGAGPLSVLYAPGVSDVTFSVLLTMGKAGSTGTGFLMIGAATTPIDLWIEDLGIDPGDTGTDI